MSEKNKLALVQTLRQEVQQLTTCSKTEVACYEFSRGIPMRKQLDGDARQQIGDNLIIVFQLIELRPENYPSKDAAKMIGDFIYRRCGGYSAGEILLAFELALAGDINVDLDHYQSFGLKYFMRVFNAYKKYKFDAIKKVEKAMAKHTTETERILAVRPKNDRAVKELLKDKYAAFINGVDIKNQIMLLDNYYHFMEDCGISKVTDDEKRALYAEAEGIVREQIVAHNERVRRKEALALPEMFVKTEPLKLAKHLAIVKVFSMLKELGITAEGFITTMDNRACWLGENAHNKLIG